MKINKTYKLEKIVSKDPRRAALQQVLVDEKDKVAVASNGKVIAIVPVDITYLDRFENGVRLLPTEAVTKARKIAKKNDPAYIGLNGGAVLDDGTEIPTEDHVPFPHWRNILPRDADLDGGFSVALDAKLLHSLAEAINDGKEKAQRVVTLHFHKEAPEMSAIKVTTRRGEAYGVIMPCMK
jgi:hypothetical protein